MLTTNLASSPWDIPANVETLKQMWADGHSASRIAAHLGVTRNAVISKVHRLKLPERDAAVQYRNRLRARRERAEEQKAARPPKVSSAALRQRAVTRAEHQHARNEPFRAGSVPPSDEGIDVTHLVGFADRRIGKQCSWISGEPTADAMCCGKPVLPGTEWCPAHYARVFGGRPA